MLTFPAIATLSVSIGRILSCDKIAPGTAYVLPRRMLEPCHNIVESMLCRGSNIQCESTRPVPVPMYGARFHQSMCGLIVQVNDGDTSERRAYPTPSRGMMMTMMMFDVTW